MIITKSENRQEFNKSLNQIWLLPIIVLAFALRLYRLDAQSLWFDEIFYVVVAHLPWYQSFLALLGQGVQLTPVFHGIIKLWLTVGDSDWLVRVPAVLLGVLTIPLVFKLGQLYFSDKVGLLAALIFAINPCQVWYGQEAKLYAFLPLAGGGAMYAFGLMVKTRGRRGLILLTLFNLIGLSTHYFMFLISTGQFLFLILTLKRTHTLLRKWILAQAIGVSPLVVWWIFIIRQQVLAVGIAWPSPQWFAPFLTFLNFTYIYTGEWSIITIVAVLVTVIGLAFGLRGIWRKPMQGSLLTIWLFFSPIVVFSLSFGRVSFYVDRYFLAVSPILTLLIISGLLSFRLPLLRWGLILIFILITGLGLWQIYFDEVNFSREDWRALAHALDAQADSDHVVITCTDGQWLALEYYDPHQTLKPDDVIFAAQVENISPSDRVAWIVVTHPRLGVHYLSKTLPPIMDSGHLSSEAAVWEANNLQDTLTVSGLSAYRYNITNPAHLPEIVEWYCQS